MENSTNTILQEFPISESDITALAFYITLGCLAILLNSLMLVVIRRCRIKQVYSVFMSGFARNFLTFLLFSFRSISFSKWLLHIGIESVPLASCYCSDHHACIKA
ncbi:hypothetical protein D917_05106 [Trichinella nativa]|uniref:Uncharacterized protein n=1 Tax=Trichinella nativa TaxID=6335 RepID=A0A1Y3EX55_9BILA|nr:hypothetical protein D917_05106 [Trichinella nativa]